MYNININSRIGDYIKVKGDKTNSLYEITAITITIYSEDPLFGEEQFEVFVEAVDLSDVEEGRVLVSQEYVIMATDEEIDDFMDNLEFDEEAADEVLMAFEENFNQDLKESTIYIDIDNLEEFTKDPNKFIQEHIEARNKKNKVSEEINFDELFGDTFVKPSEVRTIDNVLDDYSDVKNLITIIGPEKEYLERLKELEEEMKLINEG